MAVLNPTQLLEQAEFLRTRAAAGRPRQVDLRRAISASYYAVFHCVLIAASDEFAGRGLRGDPRYALVYRGINHSSLKLICSEVSRPSPNGKYRKFIPRGGLEAGLRDFASTFLRLQQFRHEADYDPVQSFTTVDAMFVIDLARWALSHFAAASPEGRQLFLTLLLFPPR